MQRISNHGRNQEQQVATLLLAWYDAYHRELPWRTSPHSHAAGERPDPYRVWLSEIMLQQTTVEAVKPYYARFLERWPRLEDLAQADTDDVMKAWAGLGYYSRARNLKKCAVAVLEQHGGRFPDTEDALLSLPGIGPYTAAAIAAIAFGRPSAVVDGNVERVVSRLFAVETPLPAAKTEIKAHVARMLPIDRPGDFAQATMDLGATICSPRRPSCMLCPLNPHCEALHTGDPERFPIKAGKKEKPLRRGAAFVAIQGDGAVLLRKRPDSGLLASMSEPPTSGWTSRLDGGTSVDDAPFPARWQPAGTVRHIFTHFELSLDIFRAEGVTHPAPDGWWWSTPDEINSEALPTVMKKAIEAAIPGITKRTKAGKAAHD